jgi:hypothetical protein
MSRVFVTTLVGMVAATLFGAGCTFKSSEPAQEKASLPEGKIILTERFDGPLGARFTDTSDGAYAVVGGKLRAKGAYNHPLWLNAKLPGDARIDFTARSASPDVDIKVEVFGDGKSYAKTASYTATSYVLVLGAWHNSRSIIARMNEHGKDRKVRKQPTAEVGRTYAFCVIRRGNALTWYLDGERFLGFDDPEPLRGAGHESFAFNNWESEVTFDDLVIRAL